MKAMVLGAGVGTRLEPITNYIPKPLVPVGNRPVIDHIVDLLYKHGFDRLICNVHYLSEKMREHFANRPGVDITLMYEEQLTGDAGGVRACRQFLQDDTFVVIMGDLLTDADLGAMLAEHRAKRAVASIGVMSVEDVSRFGVVVRDSKGFIVDFQEKPSKQQARSNQISTGIYILEPEVFNHIPESGSYGFGRQLFPDLVAKNYPVLGIELGSYWTDIGTHADYFKANRDVLMGAVEVPIEGLRSPSGWVSQSAEIDSSCKISGRVLFGKGCLVGAGVELSGTVVVGDDSEIGANSKLDNCVILPGTKVAPHSVVTQSIAGYGTIVSCVAGAMA